MLSAPTALTPALPQQQSFIHANCWKPTVLLDPWWHLCKKLLENSRVPQLGWVSSNSDDWDCLQSGYRWKRWSGSLLFTSSCLCCSSGYLILSFSSIRISIWASLRLGAVEFTGSSCCSNSSCIPYVVPPCLPGSVCWVSCCFYSEHTQTHRHTHHKFL